MWDGWFPSLSLIVREIIKRTGSRELYNPTSEDRRSLNVHLHRPPHLAHPLANPFTTMAWCAGSFLSVAHGGSALAVKEVLRQWAHKIFIQGLRHFNGTRQRICEARADIKYPRNESNRKILPFECKILFCPAFDSWSFISTTILQFHLGKYFFGAGRDTHS